mmetsp:Transcript_7324/g.22330  ORF Transcript_7324/g.22330 Transcript_7324/m.22330 type:complete len:218 (-) Transcript_7324:88-741(-)
MWLLSVSQQVHISAWSSTRGAENLAKPFKVGPELVQIFAGPLDVLGVTADLILVVVLHSCSCSVLQIHCLRVLRCCLVRGPGRGARGARGLAPVVWNLLLQLRNLLPQCNGQCLLRLSLQLSLTRSCAHPSRYKPAGHASGHHHRYHYGHHCAHRQPPGSHPLFPPTITTLLFLFLGRGKGGKEKKTTKTGLVSPSVSTASRLTTLSHTQTRQRESV